MKVVTIAITSMMLACSAVAQTAKSDAIDVLRKSHPNVKWNATTAKVADVDCDGKLDTIVVGLEKNKAHVGVVWGERNRKPEVFDFAIDHISQAGFCAPPKQIEITPADCASDVGPLPGCRPNKSCKAFTVIDEECDSINFYWDADRKMLMWWRL